MIAQRFSGRKPSIPTFLTETGHRHSDSQVSGGAPPVPSPEPSGQSPPPRPLRNSERIAADRQKITEGGVLDILLDHVRGRCELSPSQITTAFGLLKKILPDLSNSAAPRDNEEVRDDDDSAVPEFEIHIVDPKET
ncbi:hypothetical protein G5V57_16690 [Nordella sp. HKS 07]|uniref:hypothetical protein n=1 Tax=Nordella sp. HKS 07 TaxID=2712222 RepID=UPI0013E0F882|nr:hypothetical protein [Nordella sp. HKS 07]QIG49210.1 hypothetical protein G5V57_16690 [Nordella sp. HKS 07]